MSEQRIFHVISNTHWDREWRFPYQRNRQMLVEMIDRVLQILQQEPEYRAFHLDSQTIVLEDYLAIRPQKKSLIERFIREGRLLAGPWFILPEEFQVGGESLIRNLLLGHRMAAEYGHVMKVGYSPFSWGQISQLPQIYKEFGIDVIMFYRGINSLDSEKAEFIWEGADGTQVLTSRFSTMPRYNFYFYIYRPVVHNESVSDVEYKWSRGGVPFHLADAELKDQDYTLLHPVDAYHKENIKPSVQAIIDKQVNDFTTPHIFWAEGHDSSGPNAKTVQIIKDCDAVLDTDRVVHSTLEDYADGLLESVDYNQLSLVKGERRSSQYDHRSGNLYGYTTSARMYLKQLNFDTERWLQFYAEPFNMIAAILGMDVRNRYLEKAWHLVLQNSAHDSIGGCSLDAIHEDMVNRYKQAREISQGVFSQAAAYIARNIDLKGFPARSMHLAALNPNTFPRDAMVEAYLDIPTDLDSGRVALRDGQGQFTDVQVISREKTEPVLEQLTDRPMYFSMYRYHCFIEWNRIPAMGFDVLQILTERDAQPESEELGRWQDGRPVLENKYLRVSVNSNGTFDLLDKESGKTYINQGWIYDEGEGGHAWVHKKTEPVVTSLENTAQLGMDINGPLAASCRIRYSVRLPANLKERDAGKFSCELPVEMNLTLKKNARRVELDLQLNNPAEDHRLRLMFPSGLNAKYSYGEGQFDVPERAILRPDTSDWVEQPMYDYPMHHFVDIHDEKNGLAVLVDGLKEYEVLEDADRTVAVTLLRAFHYVIQPSSVQDFDDQKGSQCPGPQKFRMALYPHRGNWQQGRVYQEALNFNHRVRLFQIAKTEGSLKPGTSFFQISPEELIFSTLKASEQNDDKTLILRAYNPTDQNLNGSIKCAFGIEQAWLVTLEEKFIRRLSLHSAHEIKLDVAPKKIVTVKIHYKQG